MKIKIINDSENPLPAYETKGSAGMDLRAFLKEPVMLKAITANPHTNGAIHRIAKRL